MVKQYGIKYQLSDEPKRWRFKTLAAALREQQNCYKEQSDDVQRIDVVEWNGDDWHVVGTDDVLR